MTTFGKFVIKAVLAAAATIVSASANAQNANKWGGLYIGASAGVTWGDIESQYAGYPGPNGHVSRSPEGGLFGGHVGIQTQWNSIVLGVEASHSGGAFDKIHERGPDAPLFAAAYDYSARLHNLFTLGPRIGWSPINNWLLYATGGYANARMSTEFISTSSQVVGGPGSARHDGWFIGGGVEYAITNNWILGLEYQHVELDSSTHFPVVPPAGSITRQVDGDFDLVRARLSFKLGRPPEVYESMK